MDKKWALGMYIFVRGGMILALARPAMHADGDNFGMFCLYTILGMLMADGLLAVALSRTEAPKK